MQKIFGIKVPDDAWVDSVNLCVYGEHSELTEPGFSTILNLGDFTAKTKDGKLDYYIAGKDEPISDPELLQIFKSNLKSQMLTYIYRKYKDEA